MTSEGNPLSTEYLWIFFVNILYSKIPSTVPTHNKVSLTNLTLLIVLLSNSLIKIASNSFLYG